MLTVIKAVLIVTLVVPIVSLTTIGVWMALDMRQKEARGND